MKKSSYQLKLSSKIGIHKDKIKLGDVLGDGGFGIVYKGQWSPTEIFKQEVAVKELKLNGLSKSDLKLFENEVSVQAKLESSSIVKLYGVTLEPPYYLVMELMKGGALDVFLQKNSRESVEWDRRIQWASDITSGLLYLHSLTPPIIHGDLKSLNVLLDETGCAKLADFGLASIKTETKRSSRCTTEITESGRAKGSIFWMAPELFVFGNKRTLQSDIYALGMLLWEICSHKTPFYKEANKNVLLIIQYIKDGEREKFPKDTPVVYRDIAKKCWDGDVKKRPSAREVRVVFENFSEQNNNNAQTRNSNGVTSEHDTPSVKKIPKRLQVIRDEDVSGEMTFGALKLISVEDMNIGLLLKGSFQGYLNQIGFNLRDGDFQTAKKNLKHAGRHFKTCEDFTQLEDYVLLYVTALEQELTATNNITMVEKSFSQLTEVLYSKKIETLHAIANWQMALTLTNYKDNARSLKYVSLACFYNKEKADEQYRLFDALSEKLFADRMHKLTVYWDSTLRSVLVDAFMKFNAGTANTRFAACEKLYDYWYYASHHAYWKNKKQLFYKFINKKFSENSGETISFYMLYLKCSCNFIQQVINKKELVQNKQRVLDVQTQVLILIQDSLDNEQYDITFQNSRKILDTFTSIQLPKNNDIFESWMNAIDECNLKAQKAQREKTQQVSSIEITLDKKIFTSTFQGWRENLKRFRERFKERAQFSIDALIDNTDVAREWLKTQAELNQSLCDEVIKPILEFVSSMMPPRPCEFSVAAVGSLARGMVSPYSDFDFVMMIEKDECRENPYFKEFAELIILCFKFLGEFTSDAEGLCIDDHMLTLINKHSTCIFNTSVGFLDEAISRSTESQNYSLLRLKPIYHSSEENLNWFWEYKEAIRRDYTNAYAWLVKHHEKWIGEKRKNIYKQRYIYSMSFWLLNLCDYFKLNGDDSTSMLDLLEKKNIITKTFIDHFTKAFSAVLFLRCQTQLENHGAEIEIALPEFFEDIENTVIEPAFEGLIYALSQEKTDQPIDPLAMWFMKSLSQEDVKISCSRFVVLSNYLYQYDQPVHVQRFYYRQLPGEWRSTASTMMQKGMLESAPEIWKDLPRPDGFRNSHTTREKKWEAHLKLFTVPIDNQSEELGVELCSLHLNQPCALHPKIVDDLRKKKIIKKDGRFCKKAELSKDLQFPGNHLTFKMAHPEKPNTELFVKVYPEYPGMELLLNILVRRIISQPNREIELVRWRCGKYTYPVLFEEIVKGRSLNESLTREKGLEINIRSFSQQLIVLLIACLEDDNPDNRFVTEFGDLPTIDADRFGVQPFERGQLRVKSILLCMQEMHSQVDQLVKEELLLVHPLKMLQTCLFEIKLIGDFYMKLFDDSITVWLKEKNTIVHSRALNERTVVLPVLRRSLFREWYDSIVKLQNACYEDNITQQQFANSCQRQLAEHYRKEIKEYGEEHTAKERFDFVTRDLYPKQGKVEKVKRQSPTPYYTSSINWLKHYQSMRDEVAKLPEDPIRIWHSDLEHAYNCILTLSKSRPTLISAIEKLQEGQVESLLNLDDEDLSVVLPEIKFDEQENEIQRKIINRLKSSKELYQLVVTHSNEITDNDVQQITKKNNRLEMIKLKDCPNVTAKVAVGWQTTKKGFFGSAAKLDRLKHLNFTDFGLAHLGLKKSTLTFDNLHRLTLKNLPELKSIVVNTPILRTLQVIGCPELVELNTTSTSLEELTIDNCLQLSSEHFSPCISGIRLRSVSITPVLQHDPIHLAPLYRTWPWLLHPRVNNFTLSAGLEINNLLKLFWVDPGGWEQETKMRESFLEQLVMFSDVIENTIKEKMNEVVRLSGKEVSEKITKRKKSIILLLRYKMISCARILDFFKTLSIDDDSHYIANAVEILKEVSNDPQFLDPVYNIFVSLMQDVYKLDERTKNAVLKNYALVESKKIILILLQLMNDHNPDPGGGVAYIQATIAGLEKNAHLLGARSSEFMDIYLSRFKTDLEKGWDLGGCTLSKLVNYRSDLVPVFIDLVLKKIQSKYFKLSALTELSFVIGFECFAEKTPKVIPILLRTLEDSDINIVSKGASVIAEICAQLPGDCSWIQASIISLLSSENLHVRKNALDTISEIVSKAKLTICVGDVVGAIVDMLVDKDYLIRSHAIKTVVQIICKHKDYDHGLKICKKIIEMLSDQYEHVCITAMLALGELAMLLPSQAPLISRKIFDILALEKLSSHSRTCVLKSLMKMLAYLNEQQVKSLINYLNRVVISDSSGCEEALDMLEKCMSSIVKNFPSLVEAEINFILDSSLMIIFVYTQPITRLIRIVSLVGDNLTHLFSKVLDFTEHPDEKVRASSVYCLVELSEFFRNDDSKVINKLVEKLVDGNPGVSSAACWSLGKLSDRFGKQRSSVIDAVVKLFFDSKNNHHRPCATLIEIGKRGISEAILVISTLLDVKMLKNTEYPCRFVGKVLSGITTQITIRKNIQLENYLSGLFSELFDCVDIRKKVLIVLFHSRLDYKTHFKLRKAINYVKALLDDKNNSDRNELIQEMCASSKNGGGIFGGIIPELIQLLTDFDSVIRSNTATIFGNIVEDLNEHADEVVSLLISMLQDSDVEVRLSSIWALSNMVSLLGDRADEVVTTLFKMGLNLHNGRVQKYLKRFLGELCKVKKYTPENMNLLIELLALDYHPRSFGEELIIEIIRNRIDQVPRILPEILKFAKSLNVHDYDWHFHSIMLNIIDSLCIQAEVDVDNLLHLDTIATESSEQALLRLIAVLPKNLSCILEQAFKEEHGFIAIQKGLAKIIGKLSEEYPVDLINLFIFKWYLPAWFQKHFPKAKKKSDASQRTTNNNILTSSGSPLHSKKKNSVSKEKLVVDEFGSNWNSNNYS